MKVYRGSIQLKKDYKDVPQIILKNEKLRRAGFEIGTTYNILYLDGKIIMEIISSENLKK